MTDISMQGATLTISGAGGLGKVTFKDLSDEGTPLSFGDLNPIRTSKTPNGKMLAWHSQTNPEFSLSVIPNSESDKALRALLVSSIVHSDGNVIGLSDVLLDEAVLTIPGHTASGGTSSGKTFTFKTGFLVGGSTAIGSNAEGRMTNTPYRFQWEDCFAGA